MSRKQKLNGSNEICRSVDKSLDEYFKRLDGETPTGVYDMVIGHVERALLVVHHGARRRQPDAGGGHARHEPQHAALQARQIQTRLGPHGRSRRPGTPLRLRQIGPRGICQGPRGARRQAPVDRRHREGARRRGPCGHRRRHLHGLPRDARRPREDAASEGARRHPRAPRRSGARGRAARSTASRRSTSWSSISIRSAPRWPSPAARWRTRSRTSTSAARRWCAPRRRTGSTSASSSTPPTIPRCWRSSSATATRSRRTRGSA